MTRKQPEREKKSPKCPICEKPVEPGASTHPFCSERCRLVDLGQWLDEGYTITRPLDQRDIEQDD